MTLSSKRFGDPYDSMDDLTHFDSTGAARMVDVGEKPITTRTARASGRVTMLPATLALIRGGGHRKGDVLAVARLAGIMAAKRTGDLIPLCHPLPLDSVSLEFAFDEADLAAERTSSRASVCIEATVGCTGRTGVEMEALAAVSVAGLTIYDMCKSVDREMTIEAVRLEEKTGGRSGTFQRSK